MIRVTIEQGHKVDAFSKKAHLRDRFIRIKQFFDAPARYRRSLRSRLCARNDFFSRLLNTPAA